ncbi:MAG: dihydroorotase [Bacteroidetes bacterium]|nr:dihydroorotase [Bacteroidota bacterium]
MLVLIRKARIEDTHSDFNGQVIDILVEDGKIKTISKDITAKVDTVIEGDNIYVSPGWVDIFADYREPGLEHKETLESGMKAAAAGGFTDVFTVPNTQPAISTKSSVQYILQKAKGHAVSLHPIGAATQNVEGKVLAEMMDMQRHGAIAFSDGWKPIQNAGLMLKALEYVKSFNGILIQLPVDTALAADGLMHEGPVSTRLGMAGIPALAETIMVHRDIELLRYTGSRLHITGVSTAVALDMIRKAKKEGLDITCSVTPYHLTLNDEMLQSYSSLYKVSPPLRPEADRLAMIEGLKDGTIDCIASHHRPHEWDAKAKEFEYASDGLAIQEIVFSMLIGAGIAPELIVKTMSDNPRRIFGLGNVKIAEGAAASLTIFQPAVARTLSHTKSIADNILYRGKELKGNVLGIVSNSIFE